MMGKANRSKLTTGVTRRSRPLGPSPHSAGRLNVHVIETNHATRFNKPTFGQLMIRENNTRVSTG
jgi:hypothetical protein